MKILFILLFLLIIGVCFVLYCLAKAASFADSQIEMQQAKLEENEKEN